MKKEIKFSAKLDSADFDRAVEQMQRKLKEMYAPADQMRMQSQMSGRVPGGGMSAPSQEAVQRGTQQLRRELEQSLMKEVQIQDRLGKIIERRQDKLSQMKKQQEEVLRGSQEELKIKEKISRMEENQYRLRETYRARDQAIHQTADARDSLSPKGLEKLREGYNQGGIRGAATAGVDMLKSIGPSGIVSLVGGALVAAGAAAKVGGTIYAGLKNAPINSTSSYGSATQGVLGREVNAAYSGRSSLEMGFMAEKNQALQMANEAMKGVRTKDKIDLATSPLDGAVSSTLGGAAIGAGIGSAIPIVGTAAGAIVGGIAGFGMNAMGNIANDPTKRSLAMSGMSDAYNAEYEGEKAKQFAEKYNEAFEGLKNQNPMKTAAYEQYDSNYMRYLDTQRSMGMNNSQFHGGLKKDGTTSVGYRQKAINAGFTDEMAMQASGQIIGAGGSTQMSQDSVFALQASRQFNQTNSAGVLGQLSGGLGSSETSKQAYVKMLAEGTRIGLDSSTYAEESRKMMEVQAAAISGSGAKSGGDIDRILGQMGGFLAEKTNKGIEASKNAFDTYNNATSDTGGPRGIQRASGIMRDEVLGKMDALDRSALMNIPQDQLTSTHPVVVRLASKLNTSPEDIVERAKKVGEGSFALRKSTDDAINKSKSLKSAISQLGNSPEDQEKKRDLQSQLKDSMGDVAIGLASENQQMSGRELDSLVNGLTNPGTSAAEKKKLAEEYKKQMESKETGRQEDKSVEGAAEGSRVVLENFQKFSKELVQSPEAIRQFNVQLGKTVEILMKLDPDSRTKSLGQLQYGAPSTQSQGTKGKK